MTSAAPGADRADDREASASHAVGELASAATGLAVSDRTWFSRTAAALARDVALAPLIATRDRVRAGVVAPAPPPPMGVVSTVTAHDGAQLAVRVAGSRSPGAPVFVLTHGLCCDHGIWAAQVRRLAATGRVVTWDLRGHGGSSLVGTRPLDQELEPAVHAGDLEAVLDATVPDDAGPVVLAGHSLGGLVVLVALRDRPVVRRRTTAAALLATPTGDVVHSVSGDGGVSAPEAAVLRSLLQWLIGDPLTHYGALHTRGAAWFGYTAVRAGGFGVDPDPAQVRLFRDTIVRTPPRIRRAALRAMGSVDVRGTLAGVDVPTLVVVGAADRLVNPRLARAVAAELPHGRLLELPGAGHALVLERHALVSARLAALGVRPAPHEA